MNILLPAFQLLYFVAHFLVSLALAVYDCYQQLVKILIPTPDITSAEIEVRAKYLKKLPQHLGLICIGSQVHRISEILKLINWAIACNVNFISLYDARGILKRESDTLVKALEEEKDSFVSFVINIPSLKQTLKVLGHSKMPDQSYLHSENDMLRSLRTVTINILSMENGQRNLADLGQKLALMGETKVTVTRIRAVSNYRPVNNRPDISPPT
ncbi:transport and golgi organization 14 isoform X2 [Oratosquilla oratoria]|uniref:transport and golgi organization 14 isoform X2 n=1 Tax=Oratosquilla oratoria TaxID=337810 RepID=UPI003F769630